MAGYDYNPHAVELWDWPAQATLWRQRAEHEASRARYWQRRYEALANGQEVAA
ncbi:hypothetical protein ACIPWF_04210 [Paenarthrobacter sp. NPDC089989]|uniref:hypothetical protein n=1 Tax=unclassified Paenarthrobacter TaxID=2634190 RepID=UPI0037FC1F60